MMKIMALYKLLNCYIVKLFKKQFNSLTIQQFLILSFLTFFIACSQVNTNTGNSPLFDLKKYFEMQVSFLKTSNPRVQKMIVQNGQVEINNLHDVDWANELKPFLECDISKPALRNSYKVTITDSTCTGCRHIVYTAIDSTLAIRMVSLHFVSDTLTQVSIDKSTYSKLVDSEQALVWKTGNGFFISGRQAIAMGKENDYAIRIKFQK